MHYTYSVYESIDDVDPFEWDALLRSEGDLFMDRRFVRAVELSMSDRARFWYIVVRDGDERPVASACLYFYLFDLTLICTGRTKKVANWFKRFLPRLFGMKLVFCGLPAGTGDNHVRIAPQADAGHVLNAIDLAMVQIAKKHKARRLVFREFTEPQCETMKQLDELGYARVASVAMNHTSADYRDFDDYCAKVKSNKRRILKQSRDKFAKSGLRVVHRNGHQGVDQLYTDQVHRLYEAVVNDKPTIEVIPAEFFRELARQMPDETAFTFIENDERIVGVAASLCGRSSFHQMFVGFDYELNPSCDLYFNLFFHAVDYAWRQGVESVLLGQTSDTFKTQKLSAFQVPLFFYHRRVKRFGEKVQPSDSREHVRTASSR